MQLRSLLLPAIAGTTAMTVFSYVVSKTENKNFREPEVLAELVERLPVNSSTTMAKVAGWTVHYSIGTLFVAMYDRWWKRNKHKPTIKSGALLGAASGVVGIIGWKATIEAHPNPPQKNERQFFGHLLLAHVVFGVFSALAYRATQENKNT